MTRGRRTSSTDVQAKDYRHTGATRTNIPPAKIAGEGWVPKVEKARYHYSPHLPPVLRFDPSGAADRLPELIAEAGRRPLKPEEQKLLAEALRNHEPWLEWAGKREQHEKGYFEVDPIALHIHERVSAQAIVRAAMREDVQRDLFADPRQSYQEAVQFYRHSMDWTNRLILGDSLQVMSSLARRENLAGKVQMIYIDPPYGIKFSSNFQSEIGARTLSEKDADLTREAEMVRAYRDTWTLGSHSYLGYLHERLRLTREMLAESGSVFVQISDEHSHKVRELLDGIYGADNFCAEIAFRKTSGIESALLASSKDWLLWYAKDKSRVKRRQIFRLKIVGEAGAEQFDWLEENGAAIRRADSIEISSGLDQAGGGRLFAHNDPTAVGSATTTDFVMACFGQQFRLAPNRRWRTPRQGMLRLEQSGRLMQIGSSLRYKRYLADYPVFAVTDWWEDTGISGFGEKKVYAVQTASKVIERCMLMSTDPGDLVLDPTCGSGTTTYVAEHWGRRWITIDTSRVAIAIARQRLLTAKYDYFELKDSSKGVDGGFPYKTVPHITLKSIAQNTNLDPIFAKHEPILDANLQVCNAALAKVPDERRTSLKRKLAEKERAEGKRSVTDADRRRWLLPPDNRDPKVKLTVDAKLRGWYHWEVPFDTDPDWPRELADAVTAYRAVWRAKMDEVNACIAANADQEELVDQPRVVKGVVRVSGPFTVEGVNPEELNLGEEGLFDGTPNVVGVEDACGSYEVQNLHAYLDRMVRYIREDGLTFLNNQYRKFARVEPLYETGTGSVIHAEALWQGAEETGPNTVAIVFGPQCGPVTSVQVEDAVRASKRYDELVIAGFSFDAAASATIQEVQQENRRLRVHAAYIRPDISPGMDGLLKETPKSQLFTVFGQPEVEVRKAEDVDYVCELLGVDIYDPVRNTIQSTGAEKVAAWFLDSDFDGRTFCVTQAFFPDQNAWEKIAKALKTEADEDVFAAFNGTVSVPFPGGQHRRIAVKVIDPRGNEVMAIRALPD